MAEMLRGSRLTALRRLKVSRQEMPASTKMRAFELSTTAVFPRLPLASTETQTPMFRSIHSLTVEAGVTFGLSRYFRAKFGELVPSVDEKARPRPGVRARPHKRQPCPWLEKALIPISGHGLTADSARDTPPA